MDIFEEYARQVEEFKKKLPEAGELFINELRQELSSTGGPSSPGSPPHSQSGRLANSFRVVDGGDKASVVSDCDYALALENGTSRMAARPYINEALQAAFSRIKALLER